MAEEPQLPEDMIVKIFERLPIKPLIRFSCLSKRWRFIILFDPHFAKSQFQISSQQQTPTRRLLRQSESQQFESLPLRDSTSSSTTHSKLRLPFIHPDDVRRCIVKMSSCKGLVCLHVRHNVIYVWNPSTGFNKKLPDHGLVRLVTQPVDCFGFGYVSSTDDYKFIQSVWVPKDVSLLEEHGHGFVCEWWSFSLKANIWNKMKKKPEYSITKRGVLFNEALHWCSCSPRTQVFAFDLATEEFRAMPLPAELHEPMISPPSLGVSQGGRLCLLKTNGHTGFAELWIMRDYDRTDSWSKQYNFRIATPNLTLVSVMENCSIVNAAELPFQYPFPRDYVYRLIRCGHPEKTPQRRFEAICMISRNLNVIEYQETLLGIP